MVILVVLMAAGAVVAPSVEVETVVGREEWMAAVEDLVALVELAVGTGGPCSVLSQPSDQPPKRTAQKW